MDSSDKTSSDPIKTDRKGNSMGLSSYFTSDHGRRTSLLIDRSKDYAHPSFDPVLNFLSGSLNHLSKTIRGHVVACIGEFIGTILFFFLAFSGAEVAIISSRNDAGPAADSRPTQLGTDQLLYISLAFGFSLAVTAWTFFRISGGLFNPAVTVGMYLIGAINLVRCILLFVLQCLGAIVASYIVRALFPGGLNVGTSLKQGTSCAQGVVIEMLLTAQLTFTIFMLAAEKQEARYIAPVGIGLSIFIGELVGLLWTGGSMNPARSLGPAVVTHVFPDYHWVYWVGPLTGTILAVLMFKLIKAFEYETANLEDPEASPLTDDDEKSGGTGHTTADGPINTTDLKSINMTRSDETHCHPVEEQYVNYSRDRHPSWKKTSIAAPGYLARRETEADLSEHNPDSPTKARSRSTTFSRLIQSKHDTRDRRNFSLSGSRIKRGCSQGPSDRSQSASGEPVMCADQEEVNSLRNR